MSSAPQYTGIFGGPQRNSLLMRTASAHGTIAWTIPCMTNRGLPVTLLPWEKGCVMVSVEDCMYCTESGVSVWTYRKEWNTPVALYGEHLYLKNQSQFLESRTVSGEIVLKDAPFPSGYGDGTTVYLLVPRTDHFYAVSEYRNTYEGEGDAENGNRHELTVLKNRYEITYGESMYTSDAVLNLPPLCTEDASIITLGTHEVVRIDTEPMEVVSRFPFPLTHMHAWSMDAKGVYYCVGTEGDDRIAVAVTSEGHEVWRARIGGAEEMFPDTQPPILAPQDVVYVLTTGRITALKEGVILWSSEVSEKAEGANVYGTALEDSSLLVAHGATLRHLRHTGEEIFSLTLDENILSAPIVDTQGRILVATTSQLVCIA